MLAIEYVPIDEVVPADVNPKDHAIEELVESFRRWGFAETIVRDDRTGKLIAGHGRLEALGVMRDAGETPPSGISEDWSVPVQTGWSSRNDDEASALLIAANRLTERGGWNDGALFGMLQKIEHSTELGLRGLGFDDRDLVEFMARLNDSTPHFSELEPPPPPPSIVKRGEVWELGPHRLMCGDWRNPKDAAKLVGKRTVNLAVTSPPYADRRDYDAASGFEPIPPEDYVKWFEPAAAHIAKYLAEDGSWLLNIKSYGDGLDTPLYVFDLVLAHAREWGWHYATEFCWERPGMPREASQRLKNQFEPVYQFVKARWKFRAENVAHMSDVVPRNTSRRGTRKHRGGMKGWNVNAQGAPMPVTPGLYIGAGAAYPGNRLPSFMGTHEAVGHNAAFAVGLAEFFTRLFTDPGDVVLDPFVGSGSTLLAAHNSGRVGLGMEISTGYCDMALQRFQRNTDVVPTRNGERVSFLLDGS